ncbi:MAG: hypothetical protein BECKG1743D_GA0114223_105342 [Candidatus Kentron sp. G]|nr:MAG: hypothetical protein BECKG1743D_GA0114223_105342 [Candidatus Kentron sp. G]VFN07409.1 MAG: hypothetical protein BECKG1743E_GA0114224_112041 [Candidatus Kentron sp. G]
MSTELTENTEKSGFFRVFREFRGHSFYSSFPSSSCSFVSFVDRFFQDHFRKGFARRIYQATFSVNSAPRNRKIFCARLE